MPIQIDRTMQENMDNRTILDELAGVKYFVSTDKTAAPFGYQLLKEVKVGLKSNYLFENLYALPLGYTYENYMLVEDYNKLSSIEKQNALLNAVILDQDNSYVEKTTVNMDSGIEKIAAKITTDENVELGVNSINVKKASGTITLVFNAKPNAETYVRFGSLNISKKKETMTTFNVKGDTEAKKEVNVRSIYYNSYFGKENYLINTGYSETGVSRVTITFPQKETYSYGSLEVYSVDMSNYKAQVVALNKSALHNIVQENNSIQGDVTLDKKGVMVLSIPYSKGWSAYVDGEKEVILRGNIMNMALPLEDGEHHIILKYETPLFKAGGMVSVFAFLIFTGIIIFNLNSLPELA